MTEPLPDLWTTRDYPVLREIVRRVDQGERKRSATDIAEALGMPIEQVRLAGAALGRRGLVDYQGSLGAAVRDFTNVSGQAYLITGLHPDGDDAISRLVSALRQAAEQTADEDERGRIRKAADYLSDVPRNVAAGVMTAFLTGSIGG